MILYYIHYLSCEHGTPRVVADILPMDHIVGHGSPGVRKDEITTFSS